MCGVVVGVERQQAEQPAPPTMESTSPPGQPEQPSSGKHKPHSVELNWKASETTGIAGYYVYRAEGAPTAEFVRVTPKPIKETTYKDKKVETGKTYYYAVSAVQRVGKKYVESVRTPPILARIPSP